MVPVRYLMFITWVDEGKKDLDIGRKTIIWFYHQTKILMLCLLKAQMEAACLNLSNQTYTFLICACFYLIAVHRLLVFHNFNLFFELSTALQLVFLVYEGATE